MSIEDRFIRQADLVPRDKLLETRIAIVGVGSVGRQLAIQLAAMGAPDLQLVDFDKVDATNLTTQSFRRSEIGQSKVAAVAAAMREIDPAIRVSAIDDRFRSRMQLADVVFSCVDLISVRTHLFQAVRDHCRFFCDARMRGETLRVLAASDAAGKRHYETTLFLQSEAYTGSCTSRSTIYAASIAAGLMAHQLSRFLRRLPLDRDISLNLLGSELSAL